MRHRFKGEGTKAQVGGQSRPRTFSKWQWKTSDVLTRKAWGKAAPATCKWKTLLDRLFRKRADLMLNPDSLAVVMWTQPLPFCMPHSGPRCGSPHPIFAQHFPTQKCYLLSHLILITIFNRLSTLFSQRGHFAEMTFPSHTATSM